MISNLISLLPALIVALLSGGVIVFSAAFIESVIKDKQEYSSTLNKIIVVKKHTK